MNCYRLAKYYGQHPDTFLSLPLSKINRHLYWTDRLLQEAEAARERD